MNLKDLVGYHIFSGIETGTREILKWGRYEDCGYIKFILDGITYMALEDPNDGYRSYMEELKVVNESCKNKLPYISVYCKHRSTTRENNEADLLEFYDESNDQCFLTIGTEDTDDYYPYCVLRYNPEKLAVNAETKEGLKMYKIFNKATGRYLDRTFADKKAAMKWFDDNRLSHYMYEIVKV